MGRKFLALAVLGALWGSMASCGESQEPPQKPQDSAGESSGPGKAPQSPAPEPEPEPEPEPDTSIDCDKLQATGNDPGEIPVDLVRLASNGQELSLRSFCNETLLVLNGSAF